MKSESTEKFRLLWLLLDCAILRPKPTEFAGNTSKQIECSRTKRKITWQIAHFLKSCTTVQWRWKKNGGKWKKMEISKLLVFFILSLDTTSAWDKFCRDSCCLASLFPIVRSFFSSWDFVFSAIQLQASRTSTWSTSRLQKQHFFYSFCASFFLWYSWFLIALPVRFRYSFRILLKICAHLQLHSSVRGFTFTIVLRRKICRSAFILYLVWQCCAENVNWCADGKNGGELGDSLSFAFPDVTKCTKNREKNVWSLCFLFHINSINVRNRIFTESSVSEMHFLKFANTGKYGLITNRPYNALI